MILLSIKTLKRESLTSVYPCDLEYNILRTAMISCPGVDLELPTCLETEKLNINSDVKIVSDTGNHNETLDPIDSHEVNGSQTIEKTINHVISSVNSFFASDDGIIPGVNSISHNEAAEVSVVNICRTIVNQRTIAKFLIPPVYAVSAGEEFSVVIELYNIVGSIDLRSVEFMSSMTNMLKFKLNVNRGPRSFETQEVELSVHYLDISSLKCVEVSPASRHPKVLSDNSVELYVRIDGDYLKMERLGFHLTFENVVIGQSYPFVVIDKFLWD